MHNPGLMIKVILSLFRITFVLEFIETKSSILTIIRLDDLDQRNESPRSSGLE